MLRWSIAHQDVEEPLARTIRTEEQTLNLCDTAQRLPGRTMAFRLETTLAHSTTQNGHVAECQRRPCCAAGVGMTRG